MKVVPITLREANDFVHRFHRHNGRTNRDGGKFALAAEHDDLLIGVAIVGFPLSASLMDGVTAEVTRCCTVEEAPKGACSFLYGACWRAWRALGGTKLITYTLKSESGASLRGAGYRVVGEVKPGTWNRPGQGRNRRYQDIYGQTKLRWEVAA